MKTVRNGKGGGLQEPEREIFGREIWNSLATKQLINAHLVGGDLHVILFPFEAFRIDVFYVDDVFGVFGVMLNPTNYIEDNFHLVTESIKQFPSAGLTLN